MTNMVAASGDAQNDDAEVGRRIHMMMWDRKMTQTALANHLGIQQSAIGKKLRGAAGWSVGDLRRTARALDTSIAYLMGEGESPTRVVPDGASYAARESNPQPAGKVYPLVSRRFSASSRRSLRLVQTSATA